MLNCKIHRTRVPIYIYRLGTRVYYTIVPSLGKLLQQGLLNFT